MKIINSACTDQSYFRYISIFPLKQSLQPTNFRVAAGQLRHLLLPCSGYSQYLRWRRCLPEYRSISSGVQYGMSGEVANKKAAKRNRYISPLAKEQAFQGRWSVTDHPHHYDPLADPFTSYYFANQSVKQHLREFKRALKEEEPNKTEQVRLRQLIGMRIKQKYAEWMCPKTIVYEQEIHERSKKSIARKRSSKKMHQDGGRKDGKGEKEDNVGGKARGRDRRGLAPLQPTNYLSSHSLTQDSQTEPLKTQRTEEPTHSAKPSSKQPSQTVLANRLAEQLHQKKHQKWLLFLQQKKKLLAPIDPINPN